MKKLSFALLINLAVLTIALPATSQAANNLFPPFTPDISHTGSNQAPCTSDVACLFAGYGTAMQGEIVKMPNDASITDAIWKAQTNFFQPVIANNDSTARAELKKIFALPVTGGETDYNWLYSFAPTVDSNCQNPQKTGFFACSIKIEDLIKNYNFNNYFGVLTYNTNAQQKAAANFVQFSTMQNAPVAIADITQLITSSAEFDKVLANNPDLQNYLGLLRLYATVQSAAKSNLDYFYNQRLPFETTNSDGSVKKASDTIRQILATLKTQDPKNFPSSDPTKISPLQLENYMATHRLSDEWLMNLTKDSPVMLQRQTVILQAENLAETHRLRMSIDRLTATMSLIMMQNSYTMRQQLSGEKDNLVAPQTDQPSS